MNSGPLPQAKQEHKFWSPLPNSSSLFSETKIDHGDQFT